MTYDFTELVNDNIIAATVSNPVNKGGDTKVKYRPVKIKGEVLYQETRYQGTQVFHKNMTGDELIERLNAEAENEFRQFEIETQNKKATVLISKKGKATANIKRKNGESSAPVEAQDHNRTKQYILSEGEPVDFLIELGVQTPDGRINKTRYDKFKQINRYLEFIEDICDELPNDRTIHIIDFGCGKSYLTFAMYYYLHVKGGRDIKVTGLDLKKDVIRHCNEIAEKLGYEGLKFEHGDIAKYEGTDSVDMVVSLHACDTATDYALEKAVKWGAKVIFAVPCCHHELNRQISNPELKGIFKYGIIKERIAALVTDAVRANILEENGYDTQILEFIDIEHTPKNLLIRAVKTNKIKRNSGDDLKKAVENLNLNPTLSKLL